MMTIGSIDYQLAPDGVKVIFHSNLDGRVTKTVELDANALAKLVGIVRAFRYDQKLRAQKHSSRAEAITNAGVTP